MISSIDELNTRNSINQSIDQPSLEPDDNDASSPKCGIIYNKADTKEIKTRSGRVITNLIDLIFERKDF